MEVPLRIIFRDMARSDALEARIHSKVEKLETLHPHIVSCAVTVEERHRHQQHGRQFNLRIAARVPGHEVVANRDHHEDVYVAVRDAFDAAARSLEELSRQQRGDVKSHDLPQRGRIARLFADEGYGFIETWDGRELYFSRDNVVHPQFDQLAPGTPVQFLESLAAEGRQAKRVSVGRHGRGA